MKKLAVIGHFAKGLELLNGQTVKTKIVTEELERQFGEENVIRIDSHGGIVTLFKAPFQAFSALQNSENVLIFPAHNGLRIYAPLLGFLRRFFKKRKLHYCVIGGWLPQFLLKRKGLAKVLKKFDGIYVETSTMKKALEAQGFINVSVVPNCKKLSVLSENELIYANAQPPFKLCTFSRVMKEKGIEDAVNAVTEVNTELGYTVFSLDIYGQVDAGQTEWFDELQKRFPSFVRYGGLVPYDRSTEVLKDYFALLFPTYYEGEGFAGTLIDAFSAGIPVVASDWKYNSELVNDNVGFLYPTGNLNSLVEILKSVAESPQKILKLKLNCIAKAREFTPEKSIEKIVPKIDSSTR